MQSDNELAELLKCQLHLMMTEKKNPDISQLFIAKLSEYI